LPSEVVGISRHQIAAIVAENLGQGSHAALLARGKNIPAVAGLPGLLGRIRRGEEMLVEANRGLVVTAPSAGTRAGLKKRLETYRASANRCRGECRKPAVTRDGQSVTVEANLAVREDVMDFSESGADGVGLFRIEQLYLSRTNAPTEDELFDELRTIAF